MKVVVLYESMTGNTRRAAELIGGAVAATGRDRVRCIRSRARTFTNCRSPTSCSSARGSTVWCCSGSGPAAPRRLWKLPVLDHKPVAVFCTYAINAGKALDKTVRILEAKGARVVG